MEDFVALVMQDITEVTYLTEFTVMVRLICICLVIEALGVTISHISSLGR